MNDILVKVGADISDFSRKMADSNKALQKFGEATKETFDSFKKVGAVATATGVAIGAGLGKAVKTAADFEAGMSEVAAISGVTGKEFDILSDKAREMGATTAFSAAESAEAMKYMALAGWDTTQMVAGIEPALNLAAASGMDLARTADIVTDGMSMFGMKAEEAGRMTDTLAAASSKTNTDVDQLGEALKYVGANANAAGMDIEQTSAFLGILADNGIKGSMAGTTLNAMLRDLKKNAEDGAVAVGDQTVALYDADGQMRDMTDVIDDLVVATADMSDEQRDAALAAVFGQEALKGFNSIAESGVGSVGKLADELYNSEGAAKEMADIMQDNLSGALKQLNSAFEEAQISIGNALIPAIKWLTDTITDLLTWFNNLSDSTKQKIAIFAALSSVLLVAGGSLALIVGFIPNIISGFSAISTVVKAVGLAFSGISIPVLAAIAVIAAAAAAIYIYWEPIKEFFINLWSAVVEIFTVVWDAIPGVISAAWEFIKEINSAALEFIVAIITAAWEFIKDITSAVMSVISTTISEAWNVIKTIINSVMNVIKTIITNYWNVIETVITTVLNAIKAIITAVWNVIRGVINVVMSLIKGDVGGAWNAIKSLITTVSNAIKSVITTVWNGILSIITSVLSAIKNTITSIFSSFVSIISGAMSSVKNVISVGMNGALKAVLGVASSFFQAGKNIVSSIADGIKKGIGKVTDAIGSVTDKIRGYLPFSPAKYGALRDIMDVKISQSIAEAIDKGSGTAVKSMANLTNELDKEVGKFIDVVSDESGLAPEIKPSIDLSYATPRGIHSSLASAVSGTVDVNDSRDDALVRAIGSLERRLGDLEVVMDGERVGRIVRPHVNEGNAVDANVRRYFD